MEVTVSQNNSCVARGTRAIGWLYCVSHDKVTQVSVPHTPVAKVRLAGPDWSSDTAVVPCKLNLIYCIISTLQCQQYVHFVVILYELGQLKIVNEISR